MADNTLPPEGLSGGSAIKLDQRRAFLRRAVGVGVPVVLATVRGRSVYAQDGFSGCASTHPSGWLLREDAANREQFCAGQNLRDSYSGDPLTEEQLRQEDRLNEIAPDQSLPPDPYAQTPDPSALPSDPSTALPSDPSTPTPAPPADTYTYPGKGKGNGGKTN